MFFGEVRRRAVGDGVRMPVFAVEVECVFCVWRKRNVAALFRCERFARAV